MRVRTLQTIYYDGKKHHEAGAIIDAPESQAKQWLASGLAMQDKSLDGPSETKVESGIIQPPPIPAPETNTAGYKPKKRKKAKK